MRGRTVDDRARGVEPARQRREVEPAGRHGRRDRTRNEIVVRDHGPGISEEDVPFVFDRFYRAPSARSMPGSGLGLAIVRQVAEAHGGTVVVEAPEGGGTQMRLTLPRKTAPADAVRRLRTGLEETRHVVRPRCRACDDNVSQVARCLAQPHEQAISARVATAVPGAAFGQTKVTTL